MEISPNCLEISPNRLEISPNRLEISPNRSGEKSGKLVPIVWVKKVGN